MKREINVAPILDRQQKYFVPPRSAWHVANKVKPHQLVSMHVVYNSDDRSRAIKAALQQLPEEQ